MRHADEPPDSSKFSADAPQEPEESLGEKPPGRTVDAPTHSSRQRPSTGDEIEASFSRPEETIWTLDDGDRQYLRDCLGRVRTRSFLDAERVDQLVGKLEDTTRRWRDHIRTTEIIEAGEPARRKGLLELEQAVEVLVRHLRPEEAGFELLARLGLTQKLLILQKKLKQTLHSPGRPRDDSRFLLVASLVAVFYGFGVYVSKSRIGPVPDCLERLLQSVNERGTLSHLLSPAVEHAQTFLATTESVFELGLFASVPTGDGGCYVPAGLSDIEDRMRLYISSLYRPWEQYRKARQPHGS